MASLEPRGFIGRLYVGGHNTFREEDFLSFSHYKFMGANDPRGVASLDSRAWIYVVDHYTLLHTKYISSGPHGFREEDLFLVFSPL